MYIWLYIFNQNPTLLFLWCLVKNLPVFAVGKIFVKLRVASVSLTVAHSIYLHRICLDKQKKNWKIIDYKLVWCHVHCSLYFFHFNSSLYLFCISEEKIVFTVIYNYTFPLSTICKHWLNPVCNTVIINLLVLLKTTGIEYLCAECIIDWFFYKYVSVIWLYVHDGYGDNYFEWTVITFETTKIP